MPEGIIKDPRQNPTEKKFGIIQELGSSKDYQYAKDIHDDKIGDLRFCTAGTPVTFDIQGSLAINVIPMDHETLQSEHPIIAKLNEQAFTLLTYLSANIPEYGFNKPYSYSDLP
jgi:hypothetical protein